VLFEWVLNLFDGFLEFFFDGHFLYDRPETRGRAAFVAVAGLGGVHNAFAVSVFADLLDFQ